MKDLDQYYEILGLKRGATAGEIKQSYLDLAKVWHPDRFAHDPKLQEKAQEKLKEINNAYDILSSATDRSQSDPPQSKARSKARPASAAERVADSKTEQAQSGGKTAGPVGANFIKSLGGFHWGKLSLAAIGVLAIIGSLYWFSLSSDNQQPAPAAAALAVAPPPQAPSLASIPSTKPAFKLWLNTFIEAEANELKAVENKEIRETDFGDLDRDGDEDVAVTYIIEGADGGSNLNSRMAVFRNDNGAMTLVAKSIFNNPQRAIKLKKIKNGIILCESFSWTASDPGCCPSVRGEARFVLNQNNLQEITLR
jgi:curved DNA-binding protein CbpA